MISDYRPYIAALEDGYISVSSYGQTIMVIILTRIAIQWSCWIQVTLPCSAILTISVNGGQLSLVGYCMHILLPWKMRITLLIGIDKLV